MNATIVTIGDEILIGQIVDTNSAWIASRMNETGIVINAIHTVPDEKQSMLKTMQDALERSDIVICTGGLGPTEDDVTVEVLAEFFDSELSIHQATLDKISEYFKRIGKELTNAHRKQCLLPDKAELFSNQKGSAPGILLRKAEKILIALPGVPYEMKQLMEDHFLPRFREMNKDQNLFHKTIMTVGKGESRIAEEIKDILFRMPAHISIAYLPSIGTVRLRISGAGPDKIKIENEVLEIVDNISNRISELIYGYDDISLESAIGQLLKEKGKTLALAESCTGGHLSSRITKIPGSSAYYQGTIIPYHNDFKTSLLDVPESILLDHGAVSQETVERMAFSVRKELKADLGFAISGIAGPTGGSPEKPVGTIWMALSHEDSMKSLKLQAGKTRLLNIEYAAVMAMNMIRKFLIGQ